MVRDCALGRDLDGNLSGDDFEAGFAIAAHLFLQVFDEGFRRN